MRDLERIEICGNDGQMGADAAQRIPLRAMYESEKDEFKNPSKTFFSQEWIFSAKRTEPVGARDHLKSRATTGLMIAIKPVE